MVKSDDMAGQLLAGEKERWSAYLSWRQFTWLYFFSFMSWNRDLVARGGMMGRLGGVRCPERTWGFLHDEADDSEINGRSPR